jgi:hypothetical protein
MDGLPKQPYAHPMLRQLSVGIPELDTFEFSILAWVLAQKIQRQEIFLKKSICTKDYDDVHLIEQPRHEQP